MGNAKVHKVQSESREGCKCWDEELVSPPDVECVVHDAEYDHSSNGSVGKSIRRELSPLISSTLSVLRTTAPTLSKGKRCRKRPLSMCSRWIISSLLPPPDVATMMSRLKAKGKKTTMASR